jgi:hypothetical protein
VTNPHVAKAVAESYLTELFKTLGEPASPAELVEHVMTNVRAGHDGYPVIKLIGKNRLAIEFDLDAKPFSEATVVDEDHGEAGAELLADAHTPAQQWPAPTLADNPEGVDEDNLPEPEPEPESGDGYRSPWMDAGDEAAAKTETGKGAAGN